uniref:hypothetical protein n=1 Tax=Nitrospira cf. moscoviensis SBR1015 TaxID=96242 RepID=UPI00111D7010|nr:hypothetical protein [Nitrospira cf. moscoviensis SBR1015]
MRIVQRKQEKKSMKTRIKNLRVASRISFKAGMEAGKLAVATAAHSLEYGEGYDVREQENAGGVGAALDNSGSVPSPALLAS